MTQNDFYVAIQGIMTEANEQGWSLDQIREETLDAILEWIEEMDPIEIDEEE